LLVDGLELPFEHVSTALNYLDAGLRYDPAWWALGKLYAYHLQEEPFVHLDNDVFLWKRLPDKLEAARLFAQNPEDFRFIPLFYQPETLEAVFRAGGDGWLPDEWVWYRASGLPQRGDCCGVFGGNDLDFIRYYGKRALRLLEHPANQRLWASLEDKMTHILLLEQYLLAACVEYHRERRESPHCGIAIEYLFQSVADTRDEDLAAELGYTHLIAEAKRNPGLALRLDRRVERDFPAYHRRCLALTPADDGFYAAHV
jgi:hypothetical protein